jgi:hypothetical protein
VIPGPRPPGGDHRPPGSRGDAAAAVEPAVSLPVPTVFPAEVLLGSSGGPAAVVVRTTRGWAVLSADPPADPPPGPPDDAVVADQLTLVEAMTLADLLAGERGPAPEPDRQTRRAARSTTRPGEDVPAPGSTPDARDEEIAVLRRTVGQLEHALAARVSIERAIGVLAERHGTTPREAFEELRGRARSQGRPAAELAGEVLAGMTSRSPAPDPEPHPAEPTDGPRPHGPARRVSRLDRGREEPGTDRAPDGDGVPGARH